MNVDAKLVKDLRERTGAGMMDCKKALVESKGDLDSAIEFLRKAGVTKAEKKSVRDANEGLIISYIHHGSKLGVLLDIGCETDFVPKTKGFKELANNIAMQIAATNPIAISKNDLSSDLIDKERDIYTEQAKSTGKPNNIVKKIVDGKIEKFIEENCLINQSFIKDPDVKIGQLIQEAIAKLGENITINRFVRFALGEKN
jgi:elongation factor Ts